MILPPQSNAERDLNAGPLQQTIMKLALEDDKYLNKFKFTLRSFSFHYNNFKNLDRWAVIVGDVDISRGANNAFKIIAHRSQTKSGSIWHSLKQRIEMGF